jgi:siroheme synthase
VATRLVARSVDTLVILMGLRNLRKIMNRLLKSGCKPEHPVVLIHSATRPSQIGSRIALVQRDCN